MKWAVKELTGWEEHRKQGWANVVDAELVWREGGLLRGHGMKDNTIPRKHLNYGAMIIWADIHAAIS